MVLILFLIVVALIAAGVMLENNKRTAATQQEWHDERASQETALVNVSHSLQGFTPQEHAVSADRQRLIALDKTGRQIAFCWIQGGQTRFKVYPFRSIMEVSIEENGQTLTQTRVSRGSQAAGALVGGVLLGPAGMIIGGLSGKKTATSTEIVNSLDLRVTVEDLENPLWAIRYFNGVSSRNGTMFLQAKQDAQHWHALLSIIIRQNSAAACLPA